MSTNEVKKMQYDVLVIGAGGAGLRAAIGASEKGEKVAIVTKTLLGKAHTVMAEGGAAAALGNADPRDNWMVHFRDTMRGGKFHNDWRMARIHALEAPDRIRELERYGAVFDRTPEGKINQRNFGGHTFPRLAHVGDRTGLEIIRTLQDEIIHRKNVDVLMETTITKLIIRDGKVLGAFGYNRQTGDLLLFESKSVIIATGGIGKSFRVTSNSWEYTGDGHALAYDAGAEIVDMEFIQFHPTGMLWPPSVKGTLVTEGVRGEGGMLYNSEHKRFMFNYIPPLYKGDYAETEEEAERWLNGDDTARRPPELLTRDVVSKAILAEIEAGRASPHGGAFLDISWRPADYIKKKLPSMYHQFKVLAELDITKEPMEVFPTTHYVMGGIRVDNETQETNIKGLYAAGEASSGMHGANRLGGNSLSDLLVFGRRAGEAAGESAKTREFTAISDSELKEAMDETLAPFSGEATENPYELQQELQSIMEKYVGIIRVEEGMKKGIDELYALQERSKKAKAKGKDRKYNPSWHQALDIKHMITTSILAAYGALQRKESRGAHTRNDFPDTNKDLTNVLFILKKGADGKMSLSEDKYPEMPEDLSRLANTVTREDLLKVADELGGKM